MPPTIIINGPTGVGKSDIALDLALRLNAEIINADSMLVYKYFDIGTAKPSLAERGKVPHHLIDIIDPDEKFNASEFKERTEKIITSLEEKNKLPLIVGGTGLYLKALTDNFFCGIKSDPAIRETISSEMREKGTTYMHAQLKSVDPESAARIHPHDKIRIERALEIYRISGEPSSQMPKEIPEKKMGNFIYIILYRDRRELYPKINRRVEIMLEKGWVEEVKMILSKGFRAELKPFQSVGYKQILRFIQGEIPYETAVEEIKKDTRHYAKRQITWLRKVEQGIWIDITGEEDSKRILERILRLLPDVMIL